MIEHLKLVLQDKCLLKKDQTLVVGVSGGPDSLCLLDVLARLGYKLVVAHLDHALRPESIEEANVVRWICTQMNLEFFTERIDVREYASEHRMTMEEAARDVRYRFLFRTAELFHAQAVAVGHNADDQVETVLMHLLRGSGLSGLRGMDYRQLPNAWSLEIPLVRPLLGIWRDEISTYVAKKGYQPVIDSSNQDQQYYRNRLRHELIPFLQGYNPQVKKLLWRMAVSLRDDYVMIEATTNEAWEDYLLQSGEGYLGFSLLELRTSPRGLQRHLLRRAIYHLRPDLRDFDFAAVQRALDFLESPPRSQSCDLLANIMLLIEGDCLWIMTKEASLPVDDWPQMESDKVAFLPLPGMLRLKGGWTLRSEFIKNESKHSLLEEVKKDLFQAVVDMESLSFPLEVRTRSHGDRFTPLGMGGHSVKLSEFMINEKLVRRAREGWPLVLSAEEIVWIPGVRLSHSYRIKESTRQLVHLKVSKE